MKKPITTAILALLLMAPSAVSAQVTERYVAPSQSQFSSSKMDLGISLGSTGIGIDAAMPLSDVFQLRAGFSYMPRVEVGMTFGVQVGDDASTSDEKFTHIQGMLEKIAGRKVDNTVDMIGKPTYWNFSLLLDARPFRNKHWHFTAGFFLGPKSIAKAYNTTEDMASLMAVSIYNSMYDRIVPMNERDLRSLTWKDLFGVNVDANIDPYMYNRLKGGFEYNGRMGMHIGDYSHDITDAEGKVIHKKGDPYMMEPDENSMAKAEIHVNSFKPYLGFGYGGRLVKGDDRYHISFDCGVMFWGGTPSVVTHDGTDLTKDVEHIGGKVGRYVDIIDDFKVFPVLNLRITRRLF